MTDTSSKPIRTRFAPSPTGPLHIGGVRSALFGWLMARHHGGQFILRIEDTDRKRYVEGSEELIINGFDWLGINFDEGPHVGGDYGPYRQSERLEIYQKYAYQLVEEGKAYKCFATPEELAAENQRRKEMGLPPGYNRAYRDMPQSEVERLEAEGRPYVIRFKMPLSGTTASHDLLRGMVEFNNEELNDGVLLKSDGWPTYALAATVDDHLMQISHVTRANEWLPSYPYHARIWEALGWEMPTFVHLPVLLNPNGEGKLSKRHAGFTQGGTQVLVLVSEFREAGYLPDAIVNFLTNIGWNIGENREVFSREEAVKLFDIAQVNVSNSKFPMEKLDWLNGLYIRELDPDDLAELLRGPLEQAGLQPDDHTLKQVAPVVQTRIKVLNDVVDLAGFFFRDHSEFEAPDAEAIIQKKMDVEGTVRLLAASIEKISALPAFDHQTQHEAFKALAKELGVKNGQLFGTLRVAVTGQKISTPTFETMEILGKAESLRRINMALDRMRQTAAES
jgi:glutamyl-tRNA synthetase